MMRIPAIRKRIFAAVAAMVTVAPAMSYGQVEVELRPAADQPTRAVAYRDAQITVDNTAGQVKEIIAGVSLRWRLGGPRIVHPITVAPGGSASAAVKLPAAAVRQTFEVNLLSAAETGGKLLAKTEADINWIGPDGEFVEPYEFVNPAAYHRAEARPVSWGGDTLRLVFAASAIFCIAAAATLFVRRSAVRITALVVVVAAAAIILFYTVGRQETLSTKRISDEDGTLYVVSALRTGKWRRSAGGRAYLIPIYLNKNMMANDNTVIRPGEEISTTIRAGRVRIFRSPRR